VNRAITKGTRKREEKEKGDINYPPHHHMKIGKIYATELGHTSNRAGFFRKGGTVSVFGNDIEPAKA